MVAKAAHCWNESCVISSISEQKPFDKLFYSSPSVFVPLTSCKVLCSDLKRWSCWLQQHNDNIKHIKTLTFWCNLWNYCCCYKTHKKVLFQGPFHVPLALQLTLLFKYHQEIIYYTCHYTYFYILSTVVGKVSSFGGAILCHWRGLRLQLDSQPLEGDGASSWCWLSSCSSDRKLGNVCARGIKVIVSPLSWKL